ncbi:phospholipase A2-like isoform X2 [Hemicordylus capensis]|uniref:phospholipase A2-like isoform X2 n=1 Tax=Hemicordylus capensis TaxID=884348 RepID=UPI0023029793|nr:phospholipase A2-like isoform X2 [Hemicordylus capensis]
MGLWVSCGVWNGVLGKTHSLQKRGLLEVAGAIKCGTGRSPLAYLGYGCYCGLGGKGWPRDKTDWCCHVHDCCYGLAEDQGCNPKTWRYKWTCKHNTVVCDSTLDRCQKIMCQCDREATKCWRSATFNQRYIFWPNFLCGQTYPTCSFKINRKSREQSFCENRGLYQRSHIQLQFPRLFG